MTGLALAQGLVIGPALWGLLANLVLHVLPGLSGAVAAWVVMLTAGAGLALRARSALHLPPRTVALFGVLGLVIFWVSLAGRQLLTIPDAQIHLSLSAAIRAGIFPPELPWNPGLSVPYHYGVDLLIGLLRPTIGPDAALTTEVLGAYAWASLALVIVMTVRKGGSWSSALILAALLLTPGTWTLLLGDQPPLLKVPVVTGLPTAGLRAALTDAYWPATELSGASAPLYETPPPNVWKPPIPLAHALAVVVLERVSSRYPIAVVRAVDPRPARRISGACRRSDSLNDPRPLGASCSTWSHVCQAESQSHPRPDLCDPALVRHWPRSCSSAAEGRLADF